MIVVADASPLNYLLLVDQISVLPKLYGNVLLPERVREELLSASAPKVVREWVAQPPDWIDVLAVDEVEGVPSDLDDGERHALALAVQSHADLLLVDDWDGRQAAAGLGISTTGTVGVLLAAGRLGFVDFEHCLASLAVTNFRMSNKFRSDALRIWQEGRSED